MESVNFFLSFIDQQIEDKYKIYKRKSGLFQLKIFLLIFLIGVIFYYGFEITELVLALKTDMGYSLFAQIFTFITFSVGVFLEVIIYFFNNLFFLRGTIYNIALMVIITEFSVAYYNENLALTALSLSLIVQIFLVSSNYTKSWISSSLSFMIGIIYLTLRSILGKQYNKIQIGITIIQNLYLIILFVFIFYKQDEENRRDFYNLILSRKKKTFFRTLLREMPAPILQARNQSPLFINGPFLKMFKRKTNNYSLNRSLKSEEEFVKIKSKLSKLIDNENNKSFLDYLKENNITEWINKKIFTLKKRGKIIEFR